MFLSDWEIEEYLKSGKIKIDPFPDLETCLGSCSIDLRLGITFRVFEQHSDYAVIDLKENIDMDKLMRVIEVPEGEPFTMQPGEFVLATTMEHLGIPDDLMGRLEGRSSLGRVGIIVHSTAGVFDPGWDGPPTLELGNLGRMPVKVYPGMRICAFTFAKLASPTRQPYSSKEGAKYARQTGPDASRYRDEIK